MEYGRRINRKVITKGVRENKKDEERKRKG
jgi:hypothetical protein